MSDAREAVLARIRHALRRDAAADDRARATVDAILTQPPRANIVPQRGQLDAPARIALFARMAEAVQATVERLAEPAVVAAAISRYLRAHNLPQRLVAAPDPVIDRCGLDSHPLLRVRRGTAVDEDAVGLTVAIAGVAETGTLVLASSPDRPTLLAYLPETCIVLVDSTAILAAYEDAWDRLRGRSSPPRSVNFVTGPSRTGDIAQKLELGAHGPKRLLILIVDGLVPAA